MVSPSQIDGCGIYRISLGATIFFPFVHLVEPMDSTSVNYSDCFVLLELLNEHKNVNSFKSFLKHCGIVSIM